MRFDIQTCSILLVYYSLEVAAIRIIDEPYKCHLKVLLTRLYVLLVAQGTNNKTKDIGSVPCIDVDAAECDLSCDNTISYTPLGIAEEKTANMKELNDAVSLSERLSHEELLQFKLDNQEFRRSLAEQEEKCSSPRAPSWGNSQLNLALLDSPTGVCLLSNVINITLLIHTLVARRILTSLVRWNLCRMNQLI